MKSSTVIVLIYFPTSSMIVILFLQITNIFLFSFCITIHCFELKNISLWFWCILVMTSGIKDTFVYLLSIYIKSFENCLSYLLSIFNSIKYLDFLYILVIKPLSYVSFINIFPHSEYGHCTLWFAHCTESFNVTNCLIILAFVSCAFMFALSWNLSHCLIIVS